MEPGGTPDDPRGWRTRLPELERFLSDPPVAAAVAAGDARRLQAALEARRARPRTPLERNAIDRLLADRRAFLVPVGKAPTLFTFNGIGTRLYGKSDEASDGSHVATLFATIAYIPVWPAAQYLIQRAGKQVLFHGQVPLSRPMRLWRRALLAATAAAAVVGTGMAWWSSRTATVQLLNGLDVPVAVVAGSERIELAPGARVERRLAVGRTTFRASDPAGRTIEEVVADVPRGSVLVAYNVGGSAPLAIEPVTYQKEGGTAQAGSPAPSFLGGRPFATRGRVDFLFQQPPAKIQMRGSSRAEVRWWAHVPGGGWRFTAEVLFREGRFEETAALLEKVALAGPDASPVHGAVRATRLARGAGPALEVARRIAAALPEALEAQRALAGALQAAGRGDEALRTFRERQARAPESALAGYLRARVEPEELALPLLEELLARHPGEALLLRSIAWRHVDAGQGSRAVPELDRLQAADPAQARELGGIRILALVQAGRAGEAARWILEAAGKSPGLDLAMTYALAARLAGPAAPRPALALVEEAGADPAQRGAVLARAAVVLGTPPPGEADLAAIRDPVSAAIARVDAAAARDPGRALQLLASAQPTVLASLDEGAALLLACEASRRGDGPLARRLIEAAANIEAPAEAILAHAAGGPPSPEVASLGRPVRAALRLCRARAAAAAGRPTAGEERAARELDDLHGVVWSAAARWPTPGH